MSTEATCSAIFSHIDAAEDAINYAKGHLENNDSEAAILSIRNAIDELELCFD